MTEPAIVACLAFACSGMKALRHPKEGSISDRLGHGRVGGEGKRARDRV